MKYFLPKTSHIILGVLGLVLTFGLFMLVLPLFQQLTSQPGLAWLGWVLIAGGALLMFWLHRLFTKRGWARWIREQFERWFD